MMMISVRTIENKVNAWQQETDDEKPKGDSVDTYEDLSVMLDKMCYVSFFVLTVFFVFVFFLCHFSKNDVTSRRREITTA